MDLSIQSQTHKATLTLNAISISQPLIPINPHLTDPENIRANILAKWPYVLMTIINFFATMLKHIYETALAIIILFLGVGIVK